MSKNTKMDISVSNSKIGYTDRLQILRKKENLTQAEFAEKIDVSAVLISDIERQTKKLSLPNAMEIAKQFKVSLDWLYGLRDDTGDTASDIIIALKEIFDIDFEQKCIRIEKNLFEYIEQISNAYKIKAKEKNNVPEEAFNYWIEGIKKSYREKPTSGEKTFYYLQTQEEYLSDKLPF